MKLFDFMTDPRLCGDEFQAPSWAAWRTIARLIDGDADLLTPEEHALALRLTGRSVLPTVAPDEIFCGAGRRSGKSRFTAIVGVWLAAQTYDDRLARGETAAVLCTSPDRRQSGLLLNYMRGIVHSSEILRAEIANETSDGIEFRHRTLIEVATASHRTIRGRSCAGHLLDECAYLRSEDSALPDLELYRAALPSLVTLGGKLIAISSPHRKVGLLYQAHQRFYGNDSEERGLYIQSDSITLNCLLSETAIARATAADPAASRSEWQGLYREDLTGYLENEVLEAAVAQGRAYLPPRAGVVYSAFLDASSGASASADQMVLSIGHAQRDESGNSRLIQDLQVAKKPPFRPEDVVQEFARALNEYGLSRVTSDRWALNWVSAAFQRWNIAVTYSELDKSALYGEAAKLLIDGRCEILDDPALLVEFRLLERRPRSGGRQDLIDHPRGGRDDRANCCAGMLCELAQRELRDPVIDEQIAIEATQRAEPDTRCRPRVLGVIIDGDRLVLARRMGGLALPPIIATGNPHELAGRIAHEAAAWSAFSVFIADCSPGQPTLPILQAMNLSIQQVDLFGTATSETYLDLRTSLAFTLGEWLKHATVPPTLLHELTAIAFSMKRGTAELLDSPVGVCDALALTLLERAEFQDPRTIESRDSFSRAVTDDGRWGGAASVSRHQRQGLTEPHHLGDREPNLQRDGWCRTLPAQDLDSTIRDYDVLN